VRTYIRPEVGAVGAAAPASGAPSGAAARATARGALGTSRTSSASSRITTTTTSAVTDTSTTDSTVVPSPPAGAIRRVMNGSAISDPMRLHVEPNRRSQIDRNSAAMYAAAPTVGR
jgi:hypothetical protein